ncbi:MAG: PEP-CTERM sorting domain-containing protein [Pirellulales bacterium]|nr:PEP-CTERM sorting domain-containing protein [Pirellulales bacterium]
MDGFSAYAVTLVPEPGAIALLLALGLAAFLRVKVARTGRVWP